MGELVVAGKSKLKGDAESLNGHDGDGADSGADGQVNEGVLLAVYWSDLVNHKYSEGDDCDGVEKKSWVKLEQRSRNQSQPSLPGFSA